MSSQLKANIFRRSLHTLQKFGVFGFFFLKKGEKTIFLYGRIYKRTHTNTGKMT